MSAPRVVPQAAFPLAPPRQRGKQRSAIPQPSRPLRDIFPYSGRAKKETDLVSEIRLRVLKGGNYLSSRVVRPSTLGGEGVRYADSPCGASAYARTKKLPYQGQFVSGTRRKSCLQKNFDEMTHERSARSTAGGVLLAPPRQRGKQRIAIPQPSRPLRDTLPYSGRAKKETDLVSEIRLRVLKGGNYLSSRVVKPSTLGVRELNFCVRYGNRWILSAIVTTMVY